MKKLFIALMAIAAIAMTSCKPKQYDTAQLKFINESTRYVAIIVQSDSENPSIEGSICTAELHPNQTADANERVNIKGLHVFFVAAAEGAEPAADGSITYTQLLSHEGISEWYGYDVVTFTVTEDLEGSIKGSTSSSVSL